MSNPNFADCEAVRLELPGMPVASRTVMLWGRQRRATNRRVFTRRGVDRRLQVLGGCVSVLAALAVVGSAPATACPTCADFDFLCCDIPEDDEYYLTSFEGEGMACGGYADGVSYYATSWVRWYCGAKLQITNPANGACAVVEVADAGPAAWVEDNAGKPIIDASTQVCRDLFDSSSCGWSDHRLIEVVQVPDDTATGPDGCATLTSPLDAELSDQGAELGQDPEGTADFYACPGDPVALWFEVRNVGSAPWVDINASGDFDWGQAVRIGVPDSVSDPFADGDRISLNQSSNPMVNPAGDVPVGEECHDAEGCARTRFTVGGTAPLEPGVYETRWQLIDEGRERFGPELTASVRVDDCTPPDDDDPNGDDPDGDDPDGDDPNGDDPDGDDPNGDDPDGDDPPAPLPPAGDTSDVRIVGGCQTSPRHGHGSGGLVLVIAGLCLLSRSRRPQVRGSRGVTKPRPLPV